MMKSFRVLCFMTCVTACDKVRHYLAMSVHVCLLIRQLWMILQVIDMMHVTCASVPA